MPVNSRGPRRRRSRWCHTCSSTPSTRTPAKRAGSSDAACRHGLIWDHTVFHVVPNWRASPEIVAPSKRNCRIAQRIARTPRRAQGAHTFSLCSRNVTVWQVRSRHIQRRIVPPDPCRNTGPRRVDHLHHHTPVTVSKSPHNPGSQHSDHRTLCQAPENTHAERQQPDGSPPSQRADHTDHNDQATRAAAGRVRHRPRSLKTAGVEVRSSSRTSTSTRNPRPTPGHPHSTLKSRIRRIEFIRMDGVEPPL